MGDGEAKFLNRASSTDLGGGRSRLDQPLIYWCKLLQRHIVVQRLFESDGYSAPWWGAPLVWRLDKRPAFLHDWLCAGEVAGVTRRIADRIMLESMDSLGINWATKRIVYRSVRVGDHLGIGGQGYAEAREAIDSADGGVRDIPGG